MNHYSRKVFVLALMLLIGAPSFAATPNICRAFAQLDEWYLRGVAHQQRLSTKLHEQQVRLEHSTSQLADMRKHFTHENKLSHLRSTMRQQRARVMMLQNQLSRFEKLIKRSEYKLHACVLYAAKQRLGKKGVANVCRAVVKKYRADCRARVIKVMKQLKSRRQR